MTLSWGMMAVPVSLYTATEEIRVTRKEFFQGNADIPIGRAPVRKDTGDVVSQSDVTRMATASNGKVVPLGDDEIADLLGYTNGQATIEAFVPLADTDRYVADGSVFQVRPTATKGKVDAGAAKAVAILFAAMNDRQVAALVSYVMRGSKRFGLLRADGTLTVVLPANAVRAARPLDTPDVSDAELAMALQLLDVVGTSTPIIVDDSPEKVQAHVDSKAEGYVAETVKADAAASTADLMATLQASIDAAKARKAVAA
jgi:DNA end-binding protein Ku